MKLHAARKARLGPFPEGAFQDHAAKKQILASVTPDGVLAGYLLFRIAKNRAVIVHLTTSDGFQTKGIARLLVDELKAETKHLWGISLRCRRDYDLGSMWSRFGFTVRHSKQGRGADGALLDYWWFDHRHDDLFSLMATRDETRVLVAVDANVFYDLINDSRKHADDTRVLQADWLQDSIALCITPELYNEIHRAADEADKQRARAAAQASFRELKTDDATVQSLESELKPLFKDGILERDESDIRQVAHAIAAEVPFLVTRDTPMLDRSERIFEQYGLRILHPTTLITQFDVLRREAEYRPARLEGSRWREQLVTAEDIATIVRLFKHPSQERTGDFEQRVRHYIAHSDSWDSRLVLDDTKTPVIYIVRSRGGSKPVDIPMLRHSDHPLAETLLRHVVHRTTTNSANISNSVITVAEPLLSSSSQAALVELGFLPDQNKWWKLAIKGIATALHLQTLVSASGLPASLKAALSKSQLFGGGLMNEELRRQIELQFSPVKIVSPETPCFVVSIRPDWAAHFFDIPEGQFLMDLKENLHLGIEGAYYCSARNKHLTAPGRILWYVSKGPAGNGSMSIKACSHLDEIVVELPKDIFRRFRHLGIYTWKHVFETTGGQLKEPLMAFRFTRTERFVQPVELSELKKIGISQPQNPRRISDEQFAAVYRLGMRLDN